MKSQERYRIWRRQQRRMAINELLLQGYSAQEARTKVSPYNPAWAYEQYLNQRRNESLLRQLDRRKP